MTAGFFVFIFRGFPGGSVFPGFDPNSQESPAYISACPKF